MSKLEETLHSVTEFFKTDTAFTKTPDLNKLAGTPGRTHRDIINRFNHAFHDSKQPGIKMAFIGDSYCADLYHAEGKKWARPPYFDTWVELVARSFNGKILQIGFPGLSFVNSFHQTTLRHPGQSRRVLMDADWFIVCVSAPDRLPNRFGLPMSPQLFSFHDSVNNNALVKKGIADGYLDTDTRFEDATESYYKNAYYPPFHNYAQRGALAKLDDFMLTHNKNIIWLPCFKESMCGFKPKSGVISDHPLWKIYKEGLKKHLPEHYTNEKKYKAKINELDLHQFKNHFDKDTNNNLAQVIIDYIKNKITIDTLPKDYKLPLSKLL